jgi:TonB-dependent receptor
MPQQGTTSLQPLGITLQLERRNDSRTEVPRLVSLAALAGSQAVHAQATTTGETPSPPSQPAARPGQGTETDIGRVTTGPGQAEDMRQVIPSSTTDRTAAIEEKKQAPNILDAQPLSEIIKLPDINTAEALQRIPGISLETDSGEGRFISIRGLDSDLNAATYAGVRLPASNPSSPFGGARAVAFDTFPTGIIGGVEVSKTLRPDMDAEGLGGSINLLPRTGAEHAGRAFLDADLGGGYEPLRGTPIYHAELSAGRSFSGGDGLGGLFAGADALSAVITAVYHDDQRGVDDVEESYSDNQSAGVPDKVLSDLQLRRYVYHRKRYGVAANLDARATAATSVYVRLLWSGYLEGAHKHYLVLSNLDDANNGDPSGFCTPLPTCLQDPGDLHGFTASAAQLQQQTTDSLERIENSMAIVGGSSVFAGFRLDYHTSLAVGSDRVSRSFGSVWTDPNAVPIAYDNNSNPRYPSFRTLDGSNPADPANYNLQEIDLGPSYARDGEWAAAIDGTIPTGSGTHTGEWKFGLTARTRHKTSESTSPVFTPTSGTLSLQPYTYGAPQIFYNHNYDIGPAISFGAVAALANSALGTITEDAAADASTNTDDDEDVYAAYGQYSGRFGQAGVLAGVRVESTHATYRGNLYNSDTDTNTPATQSNSYSNVFPTVQGRYYFSDELVGRVTYATGIARPGFDQITPGAAISVSSATVTVGNPALKPTIGQNFDATLEYYPGAGQIAAAGVFAKEFSNYIILSQQILPGYGFPGLTGVTTQVQSFSNGPAHAYGVELQYQQQLRFLPQPWDGFGFSANATVVDSRAEVHPGIFGLMPSTSRLTWNAALFYDRAPLELRLAADYVGQNLFAFGGVSSNDTDVYSRARLTLDFGGSYAFSHHASVYLEGKNLLNTPLEFTEGPGNFRPIQREFYDATVLAGVRFKFD